VIDAIELVAREAAVQTEDADALLLPTSISVVKPDNEEVIERWYKIVLIGALTDLIGELHAGGEASLQIGYDGRAYVEAEGGRKLVYEFGNLPDSSLWGYIIDKLNESGLYAEIQDIGSIFISWC
jgi:hypothetical protein